MKKFSVIVALFIFPVMSFAANFGFCWAQKAPQTFCTAIVAVPFGGVGLKVQCGIYAKNIGASQWGIKMNSDQAQLSQAQNDTCDEVLNQFKFGCFKQVTGPNASSMNMMSTKVFAASEALAVKKCVDAAAPELLETLKNLLPDEMMAVRADQLP